MGGIISELINGFTVISLPCFGDGLGPQRMVRSIGPELGFQANATTMAIGDAVLAGLPFQEISGVELNAGAVGKNIHF